MRAVDNMMPAADNMMLAVDNMMLAIRQWASEPAQYWCIYVLAAYTCLCIIKGTVAVVKSLMEFGENVRWFLGRLCGTASPGTPAPIPTPPTSPTVSTQTPSETAGAEHSESGYVCGPCCCKPATVVEVPATIWVTNSSVNGGKAVYHLASDCNSLYASSTALRPCDQHRCLRKRLTIRQVANASHPDRLVCGHRKQIKHAPVSHTLGTTMIIRKKNPMQTRRFRINNANY